MDVLGQFFVDLVLPALGTAIAALVVGIASRYLKRVGIELTDAQERRLHALVAQAVYAVEEMARRNPALKGEGKRSAALNLIEAQLIDDPHVPDLPAAVVEQALDAVLQRTRPGLVRPVSPATFGR